MTDPAEPPDDDPDGLVDPFAPSPGPASTASGAGSAPPSAMATMPTMPTMPLPPAAPPIVAPALGPAPSATTRGPDPFAPAPGPAIGVPAHAAAPNGAYRIWPQDAHFHNIGDPLGHQPANPTDERAVEIFFGVVDPQREIPPNQATLQADLEKTLRVVSKVYRETKPERPERFRLYYVRLFNLAQLGLEDHASPDAARAALGALTGDLIDDEAGRVKNGHLRALGGRALAFGAVPALAYFALSMGSETPGFVAFFDRLGASIGWLRAFALLWVGCFLGVWLSYGIRTTTFTLSDLVTTDADRLQPGLRLLFAGALTMIVGMLCAMGVVEIKLGDYALTRIATSPMLAFVIGALCGISELTLPNSIGKRAAGLIGKLD